MNNQFKILKKGWRLAILFFTFFLIISSCQNAANLSSFEWLIGKWDVNNGAYFEKWEKKNDQTFEAISFIIKNEKDTVVIETTELVTRGGDIFYIPTVPNQNDGKSIEFKLTSATENTFIFENPKHDFPKIIQYSKVDEKNAKAQISDGIRVEDFEMKKME